jgi:hypothetical protein
MRLSGQRFATRLAATAVSVTAAIAGLTLVHAAPAAAACAAPSSKWVGGNLIGQDRRDINAQVSFDIKDRNGYTIGLDGCRTSGYSKTIWMNMNLGAGGAVHSSRSTYRWMLRNLPANAVSTWIEVWTRTNTPKSCAACDGPVNTSVYGFVNRRAVPLSRWYYLTAPLNCGVRGGTAGNIQGRLVDAANRPVRFDSIYAWSELQPDGSLPMQGWGVGKQTTTGYYKIENLAPGQRYVLWAKYHGHTVKRFHIPVAACRAVPLALRG